MVKTQCVQPLNYATTKQFLCNSATNYLAASAITNFYTTSKALTVVALFSFDSQTATGCVATPLPASPISLFTLSLFSGGADVAVLELVRTSKSEFKYVLMGTQYAGQSIDAQNLTDIFAVGDLIQVKISVDLSNNRANMATTYYQDMNYDAPLATSVNFTNSAWVFDANTKFWFGGGPKATKRYQVTLQSLTTWNLYLPVVTLANSPYTPYPGELLLGHAPVLLASYKLQDISGYTLADTSTTGTAYLGSSKAGSANTTYAPIWAGDSPVLQFNSTSQYVSIPQFNVSIPNGLAKGSLSANFWIQSMPLTTESYIFAIYNQQGVQRYGIKLTASLDLKICVWNTCSNPIAIPSLNASAWTLITANWALRTGKSPLYIPYYSVYANGQLIEANKISLSGSVDPTINAKTDTVIFGQGFLGKLGALKIFSPGSLQVNQAGSYCLPSTCGADLGVTVPTTCIKPLACDASCSQCTDETDLGCLVCIKGRYFSGGKCVPCGSNCDTCTNFTTCTQCSVGYYLYQGQCLNKCPVTTFISGSLCANCAANNCDLCSNATTCTQCSSGYFLYQAQCLNKCPTTMFATGSVCVDCPRSCDICYNTSTCIQCSAGFYLYNDQCLNKCPITTFISGSLCANCAVNTCDLCSNATNCIQCSSGYYLYQAQCLNKCPTTTFTSGSTCVDCPKSCDICNNATTCIQCSTGSYLSQQGQCLNNCPATTFISGSLCANCPKACDLCNNASTCIQCSAGAYLYNGQCNNNCPVTTFISSSTCLNCPTRCDICNNATTCTQCSTGSYLSQQGQCSNNCPATTFISGSLCANCPKACDLCYNTSTCIQCSAGFYLYNDQCLNKCPATTFISGSLCSSCPGACDTCSNTTTCTQCSPTFYLYNGLCHDTCPNGTFISDSNCQNCAIGCEMCSNSNTCLNCKAGLRIYKNQCLSSCPLTTYPLQGKTCQECGEDCEEVCTSGFYNMDSSCYESCPQPFVSSQVGNRLYCESVCNLEQFNYWAGCDSDCGLPLQAVTINNRKVCKFPCESDTALLYLNGTCSMAKDCDPLYSLATLNDRKFCVLSCPTADKPFSYFNGTCQKNCPSPLITLGSFCTFPCGGDSDYLYWDGTCQKACPFPYKQQMTPDSKKFCISPCPAENQYLDEEDGFCKNLDVSGETSYSVIIGDQPTQLTYIDKSFNAHNEAFSIFAFDYTLDNTWSFFGLNLMGDYSMDNWDTTSQCGCFEQVCGKDCAEGVSCFNNADKVEDIPWICHPWAAKNNYCWSLVSVGQKKYNYYNLTHVSTIALTSYGGPDSHFVSPGFTVTSGLLNQSYALGALITSFRPRQHIDLASSYRYVESEGMVITTKEFSMINAAPTIVANIDEAYCNLNSMNLPLTLTSHAFASRNKTSSFHFYMILRKPQLQKLRTLSGQNILTPQGIQEWGLDQISMDILDPCNQQFLTLQKDRMGNYFVELPSIQRFSTLDSTICIAVNDIFEKPYDLILYELKNGSSIWRASDRFSGVLSNDYVQDLVLRLNTKANTTITPSLNLHVNVNFITDDVEAPYLRITTLVPTTCQFYISSSCNFAIATTTKYLYAEQSIVGCGYLYEKAGYNCQGVSGYFYPPSNLVKTPINNFSGNNGGDETQDFSTPKSVQDDEQGFLTPFKELFTDWTWSNAFTKVLRLLSIGLAVAFLVFVKKIYQSLKERVKKWKVSPSSAIKVNDSSITSIDPTSPMSDRKKLKKGYVNFA